MDKLGVLVAMVGAVACGGGGSGGSGPLNMETARDVCQITCERTVRCTPDSAPLESCITNCANKIDDGGYRADALLDMADCVGDLACGASEDGCFLTCQPTSAHEAYEARCRPKAAECFADAATVDALCETTPRTALATGLCLFTPAVMNDLAACFDGPCSALETCFRTVEAQYNVDL